jgi:hypothetical protein
MATMCIIAPVISEAGSYTLTPSLIGTSASFNASVNGSFCDTWYFNVNTNTGGSSSIFTTNITNFSAVLDGSITFAKAGSQLSATFGSLNADKKHSLVICGKASSNASYGGNIIITPITNTADFYVSPSGNDKNPGTLNLPYKTIQLALNKANPGSTIYIRGGAYKERLIWKNSGTGPAPITLSRFRDEKVYLDGARTGTNQSQNEMIRVEGKSHLRINGLLINNNYRNDAVGIYFNGAGDDITITNCKIYNIGWTNNANAIPNKGNNAHGILFKGSSNIAYSNITIKSNELYKIISGFSETLTLTGNINGFLIEGNSIHDNTNIGIDMAGFYPDTINQARNGKVLNNKVYRCISKLATSAGIYVDGGKDINIQGNQTYENGYGIEIGCEEPNCRADNINMRNNFIFNNRAAGIAIGSVGENGMLRYANVTGNTLYKNFSSGEYGGEVVLQKSDHLNMQNNIINSRTKVMVVADRGYLSTNLIMNYNLYYSPFSQNEIIFNWDGIIPGKEYTGLADFKSSTGLDMHSIYINPSFKSTSLPLPNLHLQSYSQAINAGNPNYVLQTNEFDIDGQARKQGVRIDIGADEVR